MLPPRGWDSRRSTLRRWVVERPDRRAGPPGRRRSATTMSRRRRRRTLPRPSSILAAGAPGWCDRTSAVGRGTTWRPGVPGERVRRLPAVTHVRHESPGQRRVQLGQRPAVTELGPHHRMEAGVQSQRCGYIDGLGTQYPRPSSQCDSRRSRAWVRTSLAASDMPEGSGARSGSKATYSSIGM